MDDLDRILEELNEWKAKADNIKYDGWYQNNYREKLNTIKMFCDTLDKEILKLHVSK